MNILFFNNAIRAKTLLFFYEYFIKNNEDLSTKNIGTKNI